MTERAVTRASSFPLRLPSSIKREAEKLAAEDGTSLNQFVAVAVAEKIGVLRAADFFAERRQRADMDGFRHILNREAGEIPRPEDVIPDDLRVKLMATRS